MKEYKNFHVYADNKKLREISNDESFQIYLADQKNINKRLICTHYGTYLHFRKGKESISININQLNKILEFGK